MEKNNSLELRPEVLGQLLIMQTIICSLPDESSIFSFTCRGLADLPGVKEVSFSKKQAAGKATQAVRFPVKTSATDYGELLITVSHPTVFSPYIEYLNNFCFMIGVILDERSKKRSYEELTTKLDQIVQERTTSLTKSEEKFHSFFDASTDAMIIADNNGSVLEVNKAAELLFGYRHNEMMQVNLTSLMPERYRADHLAGINRVVATGKSTYFNRVFEFNGLRKDGREFPLELNVATWLVAEKQYFSGIIRDISSRKKFEVALRDSEEKLRIIFNSTNDGILVADAETRAFMIGNKTICEMLGYTPEEITRLRVDDIHPPESLPEIHYQFARLLRKESDIYHEAPVMTKDGSIFFADISTNPTEIGGRKCMIGLFRDVTERKKNEEAARQSQKMEAIGTLAGGIAHDFNNILAAILGYSELARDKTDPDSEIYHDLEQVLQAGNRARALVQQILTFSRKSKSEILPLQIQPIVKEVLKLIRSTLPTTIEIRQEIDENCGPVNADATEIHQIIMNLSTNAFHAMEKSGGTLRVILKEIVLGKGEADKLNLKPGRYARLDVQDTGTGIREDIITHIFEPYFTTKPQGKGTGLGLAVVYGILENYGGKIICSSSPGVGTLFSVFIPAQEIASANKDAVKTVLPTGNEKILFIDDEESIARLGKKTLTSLGYSVFAMTNSLQALEKFRTSPYHFDLVITDQTMPHMPGSELAREMIKIRPDIPVIICTGYSSIMNETDANFIGIKAFLIKPVSKEELAKEVRKVLDQGKRAG
jgi:PAS domain S-box-containing protein